MEARTSIKPILLMFETSAHYIKKRYSLNFMKISDRVTDILQIESSIGTTVNIFGFWGHEKLWGHFDYF